MKKLILYDDTGLIISYLVVEHSILEPDQIVSGNYNVLELDIEDTFDNTLLGSAYIVDGEIVIDEEENNPSVTSRRFPSIPPADVQFGTSWFDFKMGDFVLTENGKTSDRFAMAFDWCYKPSLLRAETRYLPTTAWKRILYFDRNRTSTL